MHNKYRIQLGHRKLSYLAVCMNDITLFITYIFIIHGQPLFESYKTIFGFMDSMDPNVNLIKLFLLKISTLCLQNSNEVTISSQPSTVANGCRPYQKLEAPEIELLCVTTALLLFSSLVQFFPAIVSCSDCVYYEISIVPT